MNEMSRREQNKLEKKNRILDAAIRVFAQTGFTGASMDAIAAEAELTKPTLYQYFSSKDALFQGIMIAPRDAIMLAFDAHWDKPMVYQLHRFAWGYADTVLNPNFLALARLIIGEAHRFPDIGKEYQANGPDKVLQGLMGFMEAQRSAGRLRFDDAELAAEDFWGLILSAPRNRALHIPDTDLSHQSVSRYISNGLQVFLRAYSTDPKADLAQLAQIGRSEGA